MKKLKEFFRDEQAQSTFEYILMLAVAVALTTLVIRSFIKPIMGFLSDKLNGIIRSTFFTPQNMHRIRLK